LGGGEKDAFVVECMNKDKGAAAMKVCLNACIACKKCEGSCGSDAVHVIDNVAYIDPEKCVLCGQCYDACPRGTIASVSIKGIERKPKAKPVAKPAAANTGAAAPTPTPAKPAKEWKPIEIKYDAALLPSQQVLLAGPKDISNPAPAAKETTFEAKRTDAPLAPSQLILLGLK
jgi:ferredoxin